MAELLTDLQAEALVRLNEGCFARNDEVRKHKVDAVFGNDPAFNAHRTFLTDDSYRCLTLPHTEVQELERLGLITLHHIYNLVDAYLITERGRHVADFVKAVRWLKETRKANDG
jgi:hypothetical protein